MFTQVNSTLNVLSALIFSHFKVCKCLKKQSHSDFFTFVWPDGIGVERIDTGCFSGQESRHSSVPCCFSKVGLMYTECKLGMCVGDPLSMSSNCVHICFLPVLYSENALALDCTV